MPIIKKSIQCLLVIFFSISGLFAADYDMDYACFRGNDTITITEVYFLIPRDMFEFVKTDGYFESNILIRVLLAKNDTVYAHDEWTIKDKINEKDADLGNQKIPEITILQTEPGEYDLIAIVADINTKVKYKKTLSITLPDFSDDNIVISDIQLASNIGKTSTKNKFSKYFGFDLIPNASAIFGQNIPTIFPFCEIYNFSAGENRQGDYNVRYSITDINGNEIKTFDWKTKKKPGASSVEINLQGISVTDIPSGSYNLKIEAVDNSVGKTVYKTKRFFIISQNVEQNLTSASVEADRLAKMDKDELEELFGPLTYIASNKEKKSFKKSDVTGKREIILNFWNGRDPDPSTKINEQKMEFQRRVEYCKQQFSTMSRTGWATDMGRIFILYGAPSDIERYPNSLEAKPYQIWHYHEIEGGIYFIFVDKTGFGRMELVHSTGRNELRDTNWRRFINQTSSGF